MAARNVLATLEATGDVMRLDLVAPSREVLYSSVPAFEPAAAASQDALVRMLEDGWRGSGVAIDAERNVTLSLGIPLLGDAGEILAVAVYATDIAHALGELEAGTGAEALIVNRRGRLLVGTDPEVWQAVRDEALLSGGATQVAAQWRAGLLARCAPPRSRAGKPRGEPRHRPGRERGLCRAAPCRVGYPRRDRWVRARIPLRVVALSAPGALSAHRRRARAACAGARRYARHGSGERGGGRRRAGAHRPCGERLSGRKLLRCGGIAVALCGAGASRSDSSVTR